MKTIAWYITPHGYGHGARSTDLIRTVAALRPDLCLVICTTLPERFLASRLAGVNYVLRPVVLDVGMVQTDSVRVDVDATRHKLGELLATWDDLVARECRWLKEASIAGVVADIPGIALAAASETGIPSVAMGNFGWDWIYEDFATAPDAAPVWMEAVQRYRSAYARATMLLRLPFSEPMAAFPRQRRVPLLGCPGLDQRHGVAARTGANPDDLWVLLSFTTLNWSVESRARVVEIPGVAWFTIEPLHWPETGFFAVSPEEMTVSDLFATVDVVLTKPGYGVLSDCAVNAKPIIHVEREDFREYPILRQAVEDHFASVFLPAEKLYAGDLADAITAVRSVGVATDPVPGDQGGLAARSLLETLELPL